MRRVAPLVVLAGALLAGCVGDDLVLPAPDDGGGRDVELVLKVANRDGEDARRVVWELADPDGVQVAEGRWTVLAGVEREERLPLARAGDHRVVVTDLDTGDSSEARVSRTACGGADVLVRVVLHADRGEHETATGCA